MTLQDILLIFAPAVYVVGWYVAARWYTRDMWENWLAKNGSSWAESYRQEKHRAIAADGMKIGLIWLLLLPVIVMFTVTGSIRRHLVRATTSELERPSSDLRKVEESR